MRVAAMESQDLLLAVEAIDAICKRVQLASARGSAGVLGLGLCVKLVRLRYKLDDMARGISAADVRTDEDRGHLREVARSHQRIADHARSASAMLADLQPRPFLRFALMRLFDTLVVQAEDMAETAALGASAEFADLVVEELKGRNAATAVG